MGFEPISPLPWSHLWRLALIWICQNLEKYFINYMEKLASSLSNPQALAYKSCQCAIEIEAHVHFKDTLTSTYSIVKYKSYLDITNFIIWPPNLGRPSWERWTPNSGWSSNHDIYYHWNFQSGYLKCECGFCRLSKNESMDRTQYRSIYCAVLGNWLPSIHTQGSAGLRYLEMLLLPLLYLLQHVITCCPFLLLLECSTHWTFD